jgi:hypothetical protein
MKARIPRALAFALVISTLAPIPAAAQEFIEVTGVLDTVWGSLIPGLP